jgi:hypothetical protein
VDKQVGYWFTSSIGLSKCFRRIVFFSFLFVAVLMRISRCAYTYYIWKERNNRGVHNVGVFTIDLTLKNSTVQAVQCRLHNTTISKEALFNSKFPETSANDKSQET